MTRSLQPLSPDVDETRYEIERKLGEGAAGTVYLARDRETGEQVALKKLQRVDAKTVLRLKREFRSLVDVTHPNIVKLYDMGRGSDAWFLTMEYVAGVDLRTYLSRDDTSIHELVLASNDNALAVEWRRVSALRQLALGVRALHQAGMLHRDLKPSNVMVADDRVVVLDFGLARELDVKAATLTEDGTLAGTPAYMAPEQLLGKELSAACDWYAFGVIMYEAWSGGLPIEGSLLEILTRKLAVDPVALRELAPSAPIWVNELCMALLRRDPATRPSGDAILDAFDAAGPRTTPMAVPRTATDNSIPTEWDATPAATPLFGRQDELATLGRAFSQVQTDGAVVAHVRGISGSGKSALIEHFLEDIELQATTATQAGPLLLRSRCYELEQLPFKALDAVMDALVQHLSHLQDIDVAHILPTEISTLAHLFPVLERLRAIHQLSTGSRVVHDAVNDRHRAERALRELLDHLAARQPIVLWIDDLQWGDLDSARILRDWLQEPTQARIMFVFSYRSDEITTSTCLSRLLQADTTNTKSPAPAHILDVAPLQSADVQALCEQRLGSLARQNPELVARIVREAQGSPFLASQLTALAEVKIRRGDTDLPELSIDALVAQAGAMLPPEAQQLLDVLAVGGRPMVPKLALAAAGVVRNGRALVHTLRSLNLVRTREIANERRLEVYHDRVRQSVQAALDAEQSARVHQRLLNTLEFSAAADPDWLHALALGAGERPRALEYGLAAARRADTSLAFERAAELYERCIELTPAAEAAVLWHDLALALVHCGRGAKAAEAYLQAAMLAEPAQALAFTQLAASHLLRSGRYERGEALMQQVLQKMNCSVPQTDRGLMAAIVWERARLKLRGMKYTLRAERDVPAELLARHDMLSGLGYAVQGHDSLRAALLQARALQCALEAGEPGRLVRSFCAKAIEIAYTGGSAQQFDPWLRRAEDLVRACREQDYAEVCAVRATVAFTQGEMTDVLAEVAEAERHFSPDALGDPQGSYFRHLASATQRIGARYQLGQFKQCESELQALTREASAADNRVAPLLLTLNLTNAEVIADRAASSRARLDEQLHALPPNSFGVVHVLHMAAVLHAACATGDYAWARDYLADTWSQYVRSPVRHIGAWNMVVEGTRARLLLNEYIVQARRGELPPGVQQSLQALRRHPVSAGRMQRLEGRVAYIENKRSHAIEFFRQSARVHDALSWPAEAARDRYALGALIGGREQQQLQSAAVQLLHELGVVNPLADLRGYFPELMDAGAR